MAQQQQHTAPELGTTIEELLFAKRWVCKKTGLTRVEQNNMMFEHGSAFAYTFAQLFPEPDDVLDMLIKTPAPEGETHNWFWSWWIMKWMQHDWHYINSKMYNQPIDYEVYKMQMRFDNLLEQDLVYTLNIKR